jgi:epoxyqueuosine reductase
MVDATRCISYLTIELRGDQRTIPDEFQPRMGNKIFGCDDCLDICPFNLRAEPTQEPAFQPTVLALAPHLDTLSRMDEGTFATLFHQSPIQRAKHAGLLRNVALAQRNQ